MDFNEFKEKILKAFKEKIELELSDDQALKFFNYMNLLIEKNKVMNLTAITEPDEIIFKHFVDSCMVSKFFCLDKKYIIDVGTGAGFPGIPLAIISPSSVFVLTDTLGKRIKFIDEVVNSLSLNNVKLFKTRAEDFAKCENFREKFDYAIARGVARLSVLSEYTLPFCAIKGALLAYKMDDISSELIDAEKAIRILGGMFHVKHSYKLYPDEPERCILEIKKIKSTPYGYPRKAGTPSKQPIA